MGYKYNDLTPIEALKELNQNDIDDTHAFDYELFDIIEPALKALEIIKEKVMPLVMLEDETRWKEDCYRVYDNEMYGYEEITKEEYELLKRILTK